MAVVRKMDLVGVANGPLTTATAGPGDTAFDAVENGPAIVDERVVIGASSTLRRAVWMGLSLGAWAFRTYLRVDSLPASASRVIVEFRNSDYTVTRGDLRLTSAGTISFRNSSAGGIAESGVLTLGQTYRVEVWKDSGDTTVQFRIYEPNDVTQKFSGSGLFGTASTLGSIGLGRRNDTTPYGLAFSRTMLTDTNEQIGPYVPPVEAPTAKANFRLNDVDGTPLYLRGLWVP